MAPYHSKHSTFPGTSYSEVSRAARHEYRLIQKLTPRRHPYVRSRYFKQDKVFINLFWEHLDQKVPPDRKRRLKLMKCAIDLISNTTVPPKTKLNNSKIAETLYRFEGQTRDGMRFCVQIKENRRTGRKDFISAFPTKYRQK